MAEERTFRFGDEVITAPVDLSPDEVRSVWEAVHPALANAEIQEEEDGSVSFRVRAGTKG
jgi:PRTRC genetic system protein C